MTGFEVMVVGTVEIGAGIHSAGHAGSEGSILVLRQRHVLAGSIGRVVGGMAVVGSHGVPKGAPLRGDSASLLATSSGDGGPLSARIPRRHSGGKEDAFVLLSLMLSSLVDVVSSTRLRGGSDSEGSECRRR